MWLQSFWVWVTWLHPHACKFRFPLKWNETLPCVKTASSLAFGERRGGASHLLAIVRWAAGNGNGGATVSGVGCSALWADALEWRSWVTRQFYFSLSEKRHTDSHVPAAPVSIPTNSWVVFPFSHSLGSIFLSFIYLGHWDRVRWNTKAVLICISPMT